MRWQSDTEYQHALEVCFMLILPGPSELAVANFQCKGNIRPPEFPPAQKLNCHD